MKNSILSILLTALIFNFSGCENTNELNEDEQEAAISLILTSKSWTATSYKANFNEELVLKEILNEKVSYKMDREEAIDGSAFCEHWEFQTMKNVNINFTSNGTETKIRYGRSETYNGSCGEDTQSGDLIDTTITTISPYVLNIDLLKLTSNFGSFSEIGAGGDFTLEYDIVSYSENRIELFGKKTIEGYQLEIKMVLE